jgi:2-polyprenyl-3-methyl-5-hydroxy-6-metoxy-1,4-benzoquinol methylase
MKNEDIYALESIDKLNVYNSFIFEKVIKKIKFNKVLDFGCGFGTFIQYAMEKHSLEITGHEINPQALKILDKKEIKYITSLDSSKEYFDTIVSMNTLEHIKDDVKTLNELNNMLKQDGLLILYLPQSMKIWTNLDDLVGHYRRYTKKDLTNKLKLTNFQVTSTEYVDTVGWLVLYLTKHLKIKLNYSQKKLIFYDRYIFRFFKFLDRFFSNFFGKNILITAKKI